QNQQQILAQQLLQQQNQQQQMRLYTYRLKHASAVQLAPVLTNLFSGFVGGRNVGGTAIFPNGNGGFTTINTGPATPPGNITFGAPNTAGVQTQVNPAGGNANFGRGGAGRGNTEQQQTALANQAANALVNRLAQATQTVT